MDKMPFTASAPLFFMSDRLLPTDDRAAWEPRTVKADSLLQSFELTRNTYIRIKKGKQKNTANYTQTLHSTLHRADSPSVAKCIVCAPNYTQTIHKLCIKPYIEAFQTLHCERPKPYTTASKPYTTASKPYTEPSTEHHVEVWKALPFREGLGGRLLKSPSLQGGVGVGPQKSNNFEPIFSDSTLTFLTSENTFRLPILPTRRIIFLCLPLIKIWGRQRKTRGRQIFTGCAPKNPDFKGKVTKKGGSRGSSHISVQI